MNHSDNETEVSASCTFNLDFQIPISMHPTRVDIFAVCQREHSSFRGHLCGQETP